MYNVHDVQCNAGCASVRAFIVMCINKDIFLFLIDWQGAFSKYCEVIAFIAYLAPHKIHVVVARAGGQHHTQVKVST